MMVLDKINPPTNVWFLSGDHTTEGKKTVSNVTKEQLGKGVGWVQKSSPDLWLVSWNLIKGGGWQVSKSGGRTSDGECGVSTTGLCDWGCSRCWCGGAVVWMSWRGWETKSCGMSLGLWRICYLFVVAMGTHSYVIRRWQGHIWVSKRSFWQQWGEKTGRGSTRSEIVTAAVIQVSGMVRNARYAGHYSKCCACVFIYLILIQTLWDRYYLTPILQMEIEAPRSLIPEATLMTTILHCLQVVI